MLKLFRAKKTLVKIFMGVIVGTIGLAMLIYLVPGAGGDVSLRDPEGILARVGEQAITRDDAQRRYNALTRDLGTQNPIFRKMMMQRTIDELILSRAVVYEAERLGLRIAPEEVADRLRQISFLYPGGEFIGQEQYRQLIQQQFSMSIPTFEAEVQRQALESKLYVWVTGGLTVSPAEVEQEFRRRNQRVQIDYVLFPAVEFARVLSPAEAELRAYFERYRERYQIPERRSVRYVPVDFATLRQRLTVAPREVESYYQSNRQNYHLPERVRARHLLFRADSPEVRVAARQRAEEALAELRAGKDFAALAKARSEDANSREQGGDLGWLQRGQTASAVEQVLFSVPPGSPPQIVETSYGFHVVRVGERQAERTRSLAEVRSEIEGILKEQKVQQTAAEQAQTLVKAARGGKPLDEAAREFEWPVLESPLLTLTEQIPQFGESRDFQEEAFRLPADQAGQPAAAVSEPVALTPGYAVLQLKEVIPAHPAGFEEVRMPVQADYLKERGAEQARAAAGRLAEQATRSGNFKQAARAAGRTIQTSEKVTRTGTIPELGPVRDIAAAAFTLPVQGISSAMAVGNNWVVFQVVEREEPDTKRLETEQDFLENDLLTQKRILTWALFRENVKKRLLEEGKLKLNQAAINRFVERG
jgi:peptidyl-prolyl cis-trans isomerase D